MSIDKTEIYKNSDPFVGFPREFRRIRIQIHMKEHTQHEGMVCYVRYETDQIG
jgi:hypothetical protein